MSTSRRLTAMQHRNTAPAEITDEEWERIVAQRNRYALRFLAFSLCVAVVLLTVVVSL